MGRARLRNDVGAIAPEIASHPSVQVHEGKMPVNHEITFLMQDIFNLLPNLNIEELVR